MAKYRTYERKLPEKRNDPHPIWRGIGCLSMLIIPALSLGISYTLVQMAPSLGVQLPAGLTGRPVMPDFLFQVPGLIGILSWIQGLDNLYAILLGAFAVTIVLAGVLALGYAFIYRIVGPPRYSALDAPAPNIKTKRYKR